MVDIVDERTSTLMETIPRLSAVVGRVVGEATSDSGRSDTRGRFALLPGWMKISQQHAF